MQPESATDLEIEIELLRKVGLGDRASFEQLYDRLSGTLFGIAYRLLNNREAAEDVLQDTFLQIWEKAPLYDSSRGKPVTWAITLVRNKAIDRLRALRRRARLSDELERESEQTADHSDRSSFDAVATGESGHLAREAVQKLPAEQREALELAFFGALTQSEIAERIGAPLGTVKARIRRGLAKLREMLSSQL